MAFGSQKVDLYMAKYGNASCTAAVWPEKRTLEIPFGRTKCYFTYLHPLSLCKVLWNQHQKMKNVFINSAEGWGYCTKYNFYFLTSSLRATAYKYGPNNGTSRKIDFAHFFAHRFAPARKQTDHSYFLPMQLFLEEICKKPISPRLSSKSTSGYNEFWLLGALHNSYLSMFQWYLYSA